LADRRAGGLLVAVTALNVLAFVDRQLVASLAPVLRGDLGLGNAEIGLLIGVTFIAAFAIGLPVTGVLADRVHRPRLLAAGLGLWSLATALSGTASTFGALAWWRALVGTGEATLSPTVVAMLGDRFPPTRLGFATSIFYSGIPVGFAISLAYSAAVAPRFGWRACFVLLGIAGLVSVAFVWRMADPRPGGTRPTASVATKGREPAITRVRAALASRPLLLLLMAGAALLAFTSAASQHVVNWLVNDRGYPFARAGFLAAGVLLFAGGIGNLAIGAATDRARRRGPAGRLLLFVALGAVSLGASLALYALPAGTPLFFASWFVAQAWSLGWFGPLVAAMHEMAPEQSRATVVGFGLLVVNLLGVATGPWITGVIADRTNLTMGLRASLAGMTAGLLVVLFVALALSRAAPEPDSPRSPRATSC
jgi:MFS family permease